MDSSISNFELSESTVKIDSKPSSEKSDNFEELDNMSSTSSSSNDPKDDFDNHLPETVTLLTEQSTGAKIYLVGTAHFSEESKEDVAKVIRAVQPHIIVLELCDSRVGILSLDEKTILEESKNINFEMIVNNIKANGLYYGITYLLLLNMSAHMTREIGMAPGGEFRVAFKEAAKIPNCIVQLGDRPIRITLLRALARLSWYQCIKMAWHMLFTKDKITKEDVEKCKKRDMLEQLLADMSDEYPTLGEVFVHERDIYLTHVLQEAARINVNTLPGVSPNESAVRIVGVVGIGHAIGIQKLFPTNQTRFVAAVTKIPPKSFSSKVIKAGIKLTILSLGGVLVYKCLPGSVKAACHQGFQRLLTIKIKN